MPGNRRRKRRHAAKNRDGRSMNRFFERLHDLQRQLVRDENRERMRRGTQGLLVCSRGSTHLFGDLAHAGDDERRGAP